MRAHRSIDESARERGLVASNLLVARNELRLLAIVAAFATACALPHRVQGDAARPDIVGLDGDVIVVPDGDAIVPDGGDAIDVDSGCPAGMQFCSGMCVAVDTVQRCGSCSNDCTALAGVETNGVQCSMGACVITTCQTDRGDCDHVVANGCETTTTDSTNCGTCGMSCTGTTPVCNRDMTSGVYACAGGCPTGLTRCPSGSCADTMSDPSNCGSCAMACPAPAGASATCTAGVCGFTCNAGFHLCGTSCVANTSTNGCGTTSCNPCPTDANGTATCDGTTCGIVCNAGYHLCGSMCVSSTSTATCGSSCTACPVSTGTVATCDGTNCGTMCAAGYHDCGGTCSDNTSTATCGSSCTACPVSAGTVATCDGTNCGSTCAAGYHNCSGTCSSNSSVATCGSSCTPCPTPPAGMVATCSGTACGTMCAPGYTMMASGCILTTCNNGALDAMEACDDGNNATGDGCDANCQLEAGAVVTGCPTATGVRITQRGTYVFTGNTTGTPNASGMCNTSTSGGGEQGISASVNVGGGFTITVTAQPVTPGYDIILRHGGACGGTCTDDVGANMSESYNFTFGFTPGPFFWVIDGKGTTSSGAWRLTITVS